MAAGIHRTQIGPDLHWQLPEPTSQKRSHWSIAWSDLMMTMFILFLTLFVFQTIKNDLLLEKQGEIVAGKTAKEQKTVTKSRVELPFPIIYPPKLSEKTIPRVEEKEIQLQKIELEEVLFEKEAQKQAPMMTQEIRPVNMVQPIANIAPKIEPAPEEIREPAPINLENDQNTNVALDTLYAEENEALSKLALSDFGTVELIPDKAVRIVLTADLLFEKAHADLSLNAVTTLEQIALAIRDTKNHIHVEGHTDDIPMTGGKYANNWELSLARANAVAIFLMEEMSVDPTKITVSGFSSYRPLVANNSEWNRAKNRRVEIVITKKQ